MFEFRRLYCPRAKLHAPFPFDGLLIVTNYVIRSSLVGQTLWGVWLEARGEKESGDLNQLSVFSVGILAEP